MENKKAYDYPELNVVSLNGTDVILVSEDPSKLDLSWTTEVQGNGGGSL